MSASSGKRRTGPVRQSSLQSPRPGQTRAPLRKQLSVDADRSSPVVPSWPDRQYTTNDTTALRILASAIPGERVHSRSQSGHRHARPRPAVKVAWADKRQPTETNPLFCSNDDTRGTLEDAINDTLPIASRAKPPATDSALAISSPPCDNASGQTKTQPIIAVLSPALGTAKPHIVKELRQDDERGDKEDHCVEPVFQTAKERECWQMYKKMADKGVNVSYETILRGMLTPTEYRLRKKALLSK